jgi:U3 small nucleolar RNA-associated protein 4
MLGTLPQQTPAQAQFGHSQLNRRMQFSQASHGGVHRTTKTFVAAHPSDQPPCHNHMPAGFAHVLAAGCDDSSVRLFAVEAGEEGAHYERTLARLQGRVLAVAWHPSGKAVVAGGMDGCIHALDASTGIETLRITVAASAQRPVCVWRLLVLPDSTIVSGDSEGAVQFWDGQFGSQLHRFTQLRADVLALAASPDGESVFASGVDSQVVQYRHTAGNPAAGGASTSASSSATTWVYTHYKRPHTHDVRAMSVVSMGSGGSKDVLLTGGVDTQLIVYPVNSFLQQHPARLCKCPQRPIIQLALGADEQSAAQQQQGPASSSEPKGKKQGKGKGQAADASIMAVAPHHPRQPPRLLCAQHDTLDVWQLAAAAPGQQAAALAGGLQQPAPHELAITGASLSGLQEGDVAELVVAPRHLARIRCAKGRVSAAALSPDGHFVACVAGTQGDTRLYAVHAPAAPQQPVSVHKVQVSGNVRPATAVVLTSQCMVVSHSDGSLTAAQLPSTSHIESASQGSQIAQVVATLPAAEAGLQPRLQGRQKSEELSRAPLKAWRQLMPAVSQLAASPDGSLIAAAGAAGIFIARLTRSTQGAEPSWSLSSAGRMLKAAVEDAPVTCLSFSPDSSLLATTLASGHLLVYDVATCRPTEWSMQHAKGIAACLERLPGIPIGCSWSTEPQQQSAPSPASQPANSSRKLLVHSASGFCILDVTQPPDAAALQKRKRQRTQAKPSGPGEGPTSHAGGGPMVEAHALAAGGVAGTPSAAPLAYGSNGRAILLHDPCAFVAHIGTHEALLLEKPWEEVAAGLTPPLFRHRFGS